jgi:hypothetical protein
MAANDASPVFTMVDKLRGHCRIVASASAPAKGTFMLIEHMDEILPALFPSPS